MPVIECVRCGFTPAEPAHTDHSTVDAIIECEHPECVELLTPEPEPVLSKGAQVEAALDGRLLAVLEKVWDMAVDRELIAGHWVIRG